LVSQRGGVSHYMWTADSGEQALWPMLVVLGWRCSESGTAGRDQRTPSHGAQASQVATVRTPSARHDTLAKVLYTLRLPAPCVQSVCKLRHAFSSHPSCCCCCCPCRCRYRCYLLLLPIRSAYLNEDPLPPPPALVPFAAPPLHTPLLFRFLALLCTVVTQS
jgi:hypothetical protein